MSFHLSMCKLDPLNIANITVMKYIVHGSNNQNYSLLNLGLLWNKSLEQNFETTFRPVSAGLEQASIYRWPMT